MIPETVAKMWMLQLETAMGAVGIVQVAHSCLVQPVNGLLLRKQWTSNKLSPAAVNLLFSSDPPGVVFRAQEGLL